MDEKIQVLLSYIEQYEEDYNDCLAGLEFYLLDIIANDNAEEIKQAATQLMQDSRKYRGVS